MSVTPVESGEVLSGFNVSYNKDLAVLSGGTAVSTDIFGGTMTVSEGGYAEDTKMVSGYGSMNVTVSGVASRTRIGLDPSMSSSYISMYMTLSGSANSTTLYSAGTMFVRGSSARVTDTTISSGGRMIMSDGIASNITKLRGGSASIQGGVVNGAVLSGYGNMDIIRSGVVNGASVYSGADLVVSGGGLADSAAVFSGGSIYIGGGTVTNAEINFRGTLSHYSGLADGVTVNMGGVFYAGMYWNGRDNGSAVNVIENGGCVYVGSSTSSGTVKVFPVEFASNTFSGVVYSSGGSGTVHSGTTAVDIVAQNGGLDVFAGGVVNGITVTESSYVSSGSWTDEDDVEHYYSSTITENGYLHVSSGGTATGIVGNATDPGDGWSHPFLFEIAAGTVVSGTINGQEFSTVDGTLENTSMNGLCVVFKNETATGADLDAYDCYLSVSSGAVVSGVMLRGAELNVMSGGVARQINTEPIPSSYIEYESFEEDSTEVVVEVIKGARVSATYGATVTDFYLDDTAYLYMQVASDTVVHGVSAGGAIDMENAYFANAELGSTYVNAASTTMYDYATGSYVEIAGGTVENLIINNGATVVATGGIAMNMTENGGALWVDDYENNQAGVTYSVVSNTFSNEALTGEVTVHKNTIAHDCIMSKGMLQVFSGGVVSNFYVFQKGMGMAQVIIESGAIVTNLDMTRYSLPPIHGGHLEVMSGAQIDGLRLQSNDFINLYLDTDTVITNGSVDNKPFSFENGVLSGFKLNEGMNNDLFLGEGTSIVDSWLTYCPLYTNGGVYGSGIMIDRSYITLVDGDVFEDVTLATGTSYTYVSDGTTYTNYDYGSATVSSGAVIRNVTVNNGGTMLVCSGGKVTGVMNIEGTSANFYVSSGGIIDFDLTDPSAPYVARLNNLNAIRGRYSGDKPKPKYTITVDAMQGAGDYILANNAFFSSGEKQFYLVGSDGTEYGCFTCYYAWDWLDPDPDTGESRGEYKFYSSYQGNMPSWYTCSLTADCLGPSGSTDFNLVLSVDSRYASADWIATPDVTADVETFTDGNVVLTVDFSATVVTREYSDDGGETWAELADTGREPSKLTVASNGTYLFRGTDKDGVQTGVASFTVSNIDDLAPTDPELLTVTVDGTTASLSWAEASDDFSGLAGYQFTLWNDSGFTDSFEDPWHYAVYDGLAEGTWHWSVQAYDYAGNLSAVIDGEDFVIGEGPIPPEPPTPTYFAKSDIDGNGISDVMFQYTGGDYQLGFWMNGTNSWQGNGLPHPAEWEVLGAYDMNASGNADAVLVGNVVVNEVKGAYIGYYTNADDADANWMNIGYLNNADDIAWKNKVGNLTGNADGANSIVWYAPELYALGAWTDGTDNWVTLSNTFGGDDWTLVGCGDFNGDGADSVVMSGANGAYIYTADLDGTVTSMGTSNWSGWTIRAIGDFAGDGWDDMVAFHNETGSLVMFIDGNIDTFTSIGQLDAADWFVVGAGDYNGDEVDDLLVRQYSTGMLGYYANGDTAQWNVLGYGVDMSWTVIA